MGKYALHSSPSFDHLVDQHLQEIVAAIRQMPSGKDFFLGAVILGGYGRGEGTALKDHTTERPFNDYDIVIIGKNCSRRQRRVLQQQLSGLEQRLAARLGIDVDLHLHTLKSLRHAEPSMMNIEMRLGHQTIWGPEHLLREAMPPYPIGNIPLSEGTRLLLNRGRLLLEVEEELQGDRDLSTEEQMRLQKFVFKNFLAFGDCLLLLAGKYDLYYKRKISLVEDLPVAIQAPQVHWLVREYQRASLFKIEGDIRLLGIEHLLRDYAAAKRYWPTFLLWYEGQRLGQSVSTVQSYVSLLARKAEKMAHWPKVIALNGFLLGLKASKPSWRWILCYPRYRLLPALAILLQESRNLEDLHLLQELLGVDGDQRTLIKRFKELCRRLQ